MFQEDTDLFTSYSSKKTQKKIWYILNSMLKPGENMNYMKVDYVKE